MPTLIEKIKEVVPEGDKNRHSFFQLQFFVIGKEPTNQAQIHACKRELIARKTSMEQLILSIEEAYDQQKLSEIELNKLKLEKSDETTEIKIRMATRRADHNTRQLEDLRNRLTACEEESNFILGLYEQIVKIEQPKNWDDPYVQAEYWNAKLTKEVETSMILGQPIDRETLKTIFILPNGVGIKETIRGLIAKKPQENINKTECPQTESLPSTQDTKLEN